MIDIEKISLAVKTGKVSIGTNSTIAQLLIGNPKLVILSGNIPTNVTDRIVYYSKLSGINCEVVNLNTTQLGNACGKPFPVSVIGILEPGDSNLV